MKDLSVSKKEKGEEIYHLRVVSSARRSASEKAKSNYTPTNKGKNEIRPVFRRGATSW